MANKKKTNKKTSVMSRAQVAYVTLLRAADQLRNSFEKLYAPFEVTAQQYNVLRILRGAEPDGLPTLTIAERMIERAPGITRLVDRLEENGLLTREIPPEDRRRVHCRITKEGLKVLAKLDEPVEELNRENLRPLTAPEIEQLITLLEKMQKNRVS
jgi:DNA-binding MarR family transcriptional regulator